jgi:uncharacterized membrane protein (DUF4010 family)
MIAMETSTSITILERIIVALLGGMLIGIEREKARIAALAKRRKRSHLGVEEIVVKEFPGLRTFSLLSVYGALIGYLTVESIITDIESSLLIFAFVAIVSVFAAYRLLVARIAGITTVVVMMLDFLLGLLAGMGYELVAASMAVLTTFVLAIKLPAERFVGKISYEELLWALELGVILMVIGPFFLGSSYQFYGISLRNIYLFFVLVLLTSYIGYIAAKIKGSEGFAYAALFGGIANSEATFSALLSLASSELRKSIAFDITVLTNTAMILRNGVIALIVVYLASGGRIDPGALLALFVSFSLSSLPVLFSWQRLLKLRTRPIARIENPLRFSTALKMTLFYLVMVFTSYFLRSSGSASLALVVAVGGFVSSSATILALTALQGLGVKTIVFLAIIATATSIINKLLYGYLVTSERTVLKSILVACLLQAILLIPGLIVITM